MVPRLREGQKMGFMDIGTNSIRLMIVRLNPNGSNTVIREEKVTVRLGEHEFGTGMLHPVAMKRAVIVCKRFVEVARSYGVEEIHTVATSAMREANNRNDLLRILEKEIAPEVSVISGKEEARLIYLGVSSGVPISDSRSMFMDIGGGSTEIIIGDQRDHGLLESVKLGAVRLSTLYPPPEPDGIIPDDQYEVMKDLCRKKLVKTRRKVEEMEWTYVFGSSGTILNLADISSRMFRESEVMGGTTLSFSNLKKVSDELRAMPVTDRKRVSGMNSRRADIIVGGAAVLETAMEELSIDELTTSKRGLRHGLMIDVLERKGLYLEGKGSVRERSVMHLAKECNFDHVHSGKVKEIALDLFDSASEAGIHDLTHQDRELLGYAALLHDIGNLISFRKHHHHSYYIIMNSELLGFNMKEITIIANIAHYHRKKPPKEKKLKSDGLDRRSRYKVRMMSSFLRLAENLDRTHKGLTRKARFASNDDGSVLLEVDAESASHLERWGIESNMEAFLNSTGLELAVDFTDSERRGV